MDSMRTLNTSLPRTGRPKPSPQLDLHQSFRSAALTVTNLYKSALADLDKSRVEGYQEALEDLIDFLDKENLGVGDGEGWRVRQWATERMDGALPGHSASDSDEETSEDKRARSSSPVMERKENPEDLRPDIPHADSTQRSDSAPPTRTEPPTVDAEMNPPQTIFTFSSPHSFPISNNSSDSVVSDLPTSARRAFTTPRRSSTRSSSRNLQRSAASNLFSLGNGAGQKRKLGLNEFFNIDGFHDRRDGSGGGPKRGRLL
ncbi:hypothetical protein K469DRAFT_701608 [Zopfia rhizophila CBS 207.26]|uniref:Uncharacterized protein n=1 Tax=Zopfia rhizophila CBS 207.26 TaxID=1314779 RepID=A0A6A6D9B2_9PEZI|nr:hypothetical protein K469DRAFT_701608 [Zopfia rhizophila CBS 207.26]